MACPIMRNKARSLIAGCVLAGTRDALGLPRLSIDLRFSRKDAEAVLRAHKVLAGWMERTGVGSVEFRQPEAETVDAILEIAAHGTHQIGTARMAASPDEGVVDPQSQGFRHRQSLCGQFGGVSDIGTVQSDP